GSLSSLDLRWMCEVLDIPSEGSDTEILERIIQHEMRDIDGVLAGSGADENPLLMVRQMIQESASMREQNEKLRSRIEELELIVGDQEAIRKKKDKRLVIEWEEEGAFKNIKELVREVSGLKDKLDKISPPEVEGKEIFTSVIERMETDREESKERLVTIEKILQGELESLREQLTERESPPSLAVIKGKEDRKALLKKKRVVKEGPELVIIQPGVGPASALETAKKNLRRSFLRVPREVVEEVAPYYIPLHRFLVSYKAPLGRGPRESDIYVDPFLGELVILRRQGLKRTSGLLRMSRASDLERRVLKALSHGRKDDVNIASRAGMDLTQTRRALTSLIKKEIAEKTSDQGAVSTYSLSSGMEVWDRPWKKDPGFRPQAAKGVREKVLPPLLSEKQSRDLLSVFQGSFRIVDSDIVHYPVYVGVIAGEGRRRYIVIDGCSGNLDRDMTDIMKEVMAKSP
ncbi:MAG: hypothetical protein ACMUIE_07905, partial [Thermoplasmatota archaeon]